jgi:hypothetical protein
VHESNPDCLSVDVGHHVVGYPTRPAVRYPTEFPAQQDGTAATAERVGVRTHAVRGVVVLEVAGRLGDVVQDLDRAIQQALAEGPRGVVCDLSRVLECAEPGVVSVLARAGRHVRDWSGTPVAVACPHPRVRAALTAHLMGRQLIVTESVFCAVSLVLATPTVVVETLRLAPHPTAMRASREFVTGTLLNWGLDRLALAANLVVTELVTNSTMFATTDIEVSVACNQRALRLSVRDNSLEVPGRRHTHFDLNGPRPTAVAGLSRALGVLRAADGGKVAWAVLNATRPSPLTTSPQPATALQGSPQFTDAPGGAELSPLAV